MGKLTAKQVKHYEGMLEGAIVVMNSSTKDEAYSFLFKDAVGNIKKYSSILGADIALEVMRYSRDELKLSKKAESTLKSIETALSCKRNYNDIYHYGY